MTGYPATIKNPADRESVELKLGGECLDSVPSQILVYELVDLTRVQAALNLL
jgi:hypothetical protein